MKALTFFGTAAAIAACAANGLLGCADSPGVDSAGSGHSPAGSGSTDASTGSGAGAGTGGSGATGGSSSSSSSSGSGGTGACDDLDKTCAHEITFPAGNESSVEVRGNFKPDGWTQGMAMVKQGASWTATIDVPYGFSVQYKLVIDGTTWIADPGAPNSVPDGFGGQNSLIDAPMCENFACSPAPALRFAVIGDFGAAAMGEDMKQREADVAALVDSWKPQLILTTGDNNYPDGEASTIDYNIGQFYHQYIGNYTGTYGAGAAQNQFYPCLGNHDWHPGNVQAYTDYFTLPGNERYWDYAQGPVHFFCIDSDTDEPDGTTASSTQGQWLQAALGAASEPFKLVFMHHAPYSSGDHGSSDWMQWPFAAWGANGVFAGHDHSYERLDIDGTPYFVNGIGGAGSYPFPGQLAQSQMRFTGGVGAMLIEVSADEQAMVSKTVTTDRILRDNVRMTP